MFAALLDLPMPVIAAVGGFALGGGFELALSCDLIVADETAVFGLTEVTVGLVPGGGGTQLLARRIGAGRAADLVLTGSQGRRARRRFGSASSTAPRQMCTSGSWRWTSRPRSKRNSPLAVRYAKHALRSGLDTPLHDGLEIEDAAWRAAAMSADRREGISAFHREARAEVVGAMSDLPARISLREVGPRDGLQNEAPVSTAAKVELVDALSRTGVGRIETVSFVSPRAIPQMADADEVWASIYACAFDYLLGAGSESAWCGTRAGRRVSCHRDRGVGIRIRTTSQREPLDSRVARRHRAGDFPCARAGCCVSRDGGDGVGLPVRGRRPSKPGRFGG